jgi:hypothetical protein
MGRWESSQTTLVYYTYIHSTCTKVGSDAPHAHKGARDRRGSLTHCSSASPPPIDYPVSGGGEAANAASLSFWAASGTQRRSRSYRLQLRPTHTATLNNAIVLRSATTSTCRVFDCGLDTSDHGTDLSHLGPSGETLDRCHGSVEGAVGIAVSSVREKVRICEVCGKGEACGHAHGA